MLVGFVGTRDGLTRAAEGMLEETLRKYYQLAADVQPQFHAPALVGASTQALDLARQLGFACTAHLTIDKSYRNAFIHEREGRKPKLIEPKPYNAVNRAIVTIVNAFCAAPATTIMTFNSNTWHAIEFARNKRMLVAVVFPDGKLRLG